MKRVFGRIEAIFDIAYLFSALILALVLLSGSLGNSARVLSGVMALILAAGDAFHLMPRIIVIMTGKEERMRRMLGRGKQVTSITMTIFYMLLWQIGVIVFLPKDMIAWSYAVYILAAVRVFLCLLTHNKWQERYPPLNWAIWRNIPFVLQGVIVAVLYFSYRNAAQGLGLMWIAIVLSFMFYIPVILWSNKNPRIGMLMLPKTCCYIWILAMCLSL